MNYLAHAYLSFGHSDILAGNIISDFVKGKKQYDYPVCVQKGIRLHRLIDQFTDQHPVTKTASQYFKPAVGKYAGAFMDIVYDHFLALDETTNSATQWQQFSENTYRQLAGYQEFFPEKFSAMFPYMQQYNWLYNYRFTWGIERSFKGLTNRAAHLSDALPAFKTFELHYAELQSLYLQFFPEIKNFASQELQQLLTQ